MTRRRCVITDYMGDDTSLEEELLGQAGFDVFVATSPDPETWAGRAAEADAILTRHAPVRADTIRLLKRCRVISRYGTGHDNIDIEEALSRGIVVTNVPGYCTDEVADHAMTLLLMAARHVDVLTNSVRAGDWTPNPLPPIRRIRGRRLGLIGLGRIGAAVGVRAQAFGLQVHAYDPFVSKAPDDVVIEESVEELLRSADFVSLHAPLTHNTKHILDTDRLALLPEGAIVINVSRGGLLDLGALLDALDAGRLAGAAIDVAEQEPLPPDDRSRNHPGLIVTPHMGYYSTTSVEEAKRRSASEIIRVINGEPPENPVYLTK